MVQTWKSRHSQNWWSIGQASDQLVALPYILARCSRVRWGNGAWKEIASHGGVGGEVQRKVWGKGRLGGCDNGDGGDDAEDDDYDGDEIDDNHEEEVGDDFNEEEGGGDDDDLENEEEQKRW